MTQATALRQKIGRNPALDFTKGVLVLFMVLYHWINYFIGPQWPHYRYLRFLSPSFIFITGFMISQVYLSKYNVNDTQLVKRLVTRGLKLLGIFVVLNVLRASVLPLFHGTTVTIANVTINNLIATFITGAFETKIVSFYILVPIAYLLIMCGLLMVVARRHRHSIHATGVILFGAIGLCAWQGAKSQLLELVAIGMLGTMLGFCPSEIVNKTMRHRFIFGVAYCLYALAVGQWDVPFPLEVAGTFLSVAFIYLIGSQYYTSGYLHSTVLLLGRYSLWAYISQIAILQALEACIRRSGLGDAGLLISFPSAFALNIVAVEGLDRVRPRVPKIDDFYKMVFN